MAQSPGAPDVQDAAIRARVDQERARLLGEAGLPEVRHFRRLPERSFLASERDRVTILIGGLTVRHEVLIQAVLARLRLSLRAAARAGRRRLPARRSSTATTACATPRTSRSAAWSQYLQAARSARPLPPAKSSMATCSSPPAVAARAASACTRPSTARAAQRRFRRLPRAYLPAERRREGAARRTRA